MNTERLVIVGFFIAIVIYIVTLVISPALEYKECEVGIVNISFYSDVGPSGIFDKNDNPLKVHTFSGEEFLINTSYTAYQISKVFPEGREYIISYCNTTKVNIARNDWFNRNIYYRTHKAIQ